MYGGWGVQSILLLNSKTSILITLRRLEASQIVALLYLIFCWPCITVYQYSETNTMHFLFNLLTIKGLYMFRALLAHRQEAPHKRHLVYCVLCQLDAPGWSVTPNVVHSTDITRTQYTKRRLCSTSWGYASNARNRYRPLVLNKLNKKCIALISRYL
jgi:hypothetical protein